MLKHLQKSVEEEELVWKSKMAASEEQLRMVSRGVNWQAPGDTISITVHVPRYDTDTVLYGDNCDTITSKKLENKMCTP